MTLPEGRRGQWLAIGIFLIIFILMVRFLFFPAWTYYKGIQISIEDTLFDIQAYQRTAQHLPVLQSLFKEVQKHKSLQPFFLVGENYSLAAASLQHFLQNLVRAQDGRILSMRVLPPAEDKVLEQVSLQADFYISVSGLQTLVHALESNQPFLFIDQLTIIVKPGSRDHVLNVRIVVQGLRSPNLPISKN